MKRFLSKRRRNGLSRGQIHRDQVLKYIFIPVLSVSTSLKAAQLIQSHSRPSGSCWFLKEQIGLRANNWSPIHYCNTGFKDTPFPSPLLLCYPKILLLCIICNFKIATQPQYEFSKPLGKVLRKLYSCVSLWLRAQKPFKGLVSYDFIFSFTSELLFWGAFGARG